MTQAQALKKAKDLWGKTAAVKKAKCFHWELQPRMVEVNGKRTRVPQQGPTFCAEHGPTSGCPGGRPWYEVGTIQLGLFFMIKGGGDSWEAAFKQAKERKL